MISELAKYVYDHTERGECQCGQCADKSDNPDPVGHTIDMVFFKVAKVGSPTLEEFRKLTKDSKDGEFCEADPLDEQEHNYMELGGWLGDQGLAMLYMALGVSLGAFKLLSPAMLGLSGQMAMQMAQAGMLSIQAIPVEVTA